MSIFVIVAFVTGLCAGVFVGIFIGALGHRWLRQDSADIPGGRHGDRPDGKGRDDGRY